MKVIKASHKKHVYSKWLQSELYRMKNKLSKEDIEIIEKPNLEDDVENRRRENLLFDKYGRSAILEKLPSEITWHEVAIEEEDIGKLYLIPVFDWFMDTGRTFKLENTVKHLSPNRGFNLAEDNKGAVVHHDKAEIIAKLQQKNLDDIVMISTSLKDKPITIIDGTHRSAFLIRNNNLVGTKGFLGIASNLSDCLWSIERASMQNDLQELSQYAAIGMLW